MSDNGKEAMLNAAVSIGKFYAFLAQALRTASGSQGSDQLPEGVLDVQLGQIRAELAPLLEKNHVVKENLEKVDLEISRIRKAAADPTTREVGQRQAKDYLPQIEERARTVSDLVGLFRRL